MAPGALLLGNDCHCFECSHDHGVGDRCLSFQFAPEFLETVVGAIPGARRMSFTVPRLPPNAACCRSSPRPKPRAMTVTRADWRKRRCALPARLPAHLPRVKAATRRRTSRDEKRIGAVLRRIEAQADESLSVSELARGAAMSPYHFLRTFRAVVGMTPHQFILHTRLNRAAVRLRRTSESVSAIAFAAGFGDLSTFNRRFQRIVGQSPSAYRARSRR